MIFDRAIKAKNEATETLILDDASGWRVGTADTSKMGAMKLSAVNRCVECLTDSLSKMPIFVMDENTKERKYGHPLMSLLERRPNEAMTPSVYKKLMETNRLLGGNGYAVICRSRLNARPVELLPLPRELVQPYFDTNGRLWYICQNPLTGERRRISQWDMIHYKAFTNDGVHGISVLSRASEVVATGRMMQQYEGGFYSKNARPSGVLTVDTELKTESKDKVRAEWEKMHSGVNNAFRIAVLDLGLKYQPIALTQHDAQFVESKAVTVEDISRFFGVPLYKLMAGKQSYNSNEQNSIDYINGTLSPIVTQCDQEDSYKLLFDSEIAKGLKAKRNMMAELKGDTSARAVWYRVMRETGAFSPNDILALEDMPKVEGGDSRYASLNYVPLEDFKALSLARNMKGGDNK